MEYEKIKQLMNDMGDSNLTEINIDFPDGTKISMKKPINNVEAIINRQQDEIINNSENVGEIVNHPEDVVAINNSPQTGNIIKSPMVGIFYIKPSPTDEPYVEIGSEVKKGEIVCIIEAMKLMNEIESEFSGSITEIFVNDGDSVEYGTPLFRIGE